MEPLEAKIYRLLEKLISETPDYESCFVISVEQKGENRLNVYLDADDKLTIGTCGRISKYLEAHIEENGWLPEKYVIEVSSPGAEKPFQQVRQMKKHVGRNLKFSKGEEDLEGTLLSVEDGNLSVEHKRVEKIGKKKRRYKETISYAFEDLQDVKIKLAFK